MVITEKRKDGSFRCAVSFKTKDIKDRYHLSRTKQSFRKECDVNFLMKKYADLGIEPMIMPGALYLDLTGVSDLQSHLDKIGRANEAFMKLPPEVRRRFDDNVADAIDFLMDDANYEEALKLKMRLPDPVKEEAKRVAVEAANKASMEAAKAAAEALKKPQGS